MSLNKNYLLPNECQNKKEFSTMFNSSLNIYSTCLSKSLNVAQIILLTEVIQELI